MERAKAVSHSIDISQRASKSSKISQSAKPPSNDRSALTSPAQRERGIFKSLTSAAATSSLIDPIPNPDRGNLQCPEYSPLRHRAALERLLAVAAGADPKFDSAPKIWTTFAVAKHLGVIHSPLTDYIITWLRTYPNSMFFGGPN